MILTKEQTTTSGDKLALSELTIRVERSEILGLLRPTVARTSTTSIILADRMPRTTRPAQVAGFVDVAQAVEVKRRIGYVPESGALYESLTPAEYLELVACLHHINPSSSAARSDELLGLFGLLGVRNQ